MNDTISVARAGEWMDPKELRERTVALLGVVPDITFDLKGVDYLDGCALQILLAVKAEQDRRGGRCALINASQPLRRWFEYAGSADLLDHRANSAESGGAS